MNVEFKIHEEMIFNCLYYCMIKIVFFLTSDNFPNVFKKENKLKTKLENFQHNKKNE